MYLDGDTTTLMHCGELFLMCLYVEPEMERKLLARD